MWKSISSKSPLNGFLVFSIVDVSESIATELEDLLAGRIVSCYISPDTLSKIAAEEGNDPLVLFREHLLPDDPKIRNGDFGEIIARQVLEHDPPKPRFPLERWRYRQQKNDPIFGPDLIGYVFHRGVSSPSPDDVLIRCEAKARFHSVKKEIVREVCEQVVNDYATKLAESLFLMQTKLRMEGKTAQANEVKRFRQPYPTSFRHRLIPAVVHRASTWDDSYLAHAPKTGSKSVEMELLLVMVDGPDSLINSVVENAVVPG